MVSSTARPVAHNMRPNRNLLCFVNKGNFCATYVTEATVDSPLFPILELHDGSSLLL